MATPLQVFLITIGFGAVVGGFGIWAAIASQSASRKDR